MNLRLYLIGLMLLCLPVFWLYDLPYFLLFLSILCFIKTVQSVVNLIKSRKNIIWLQILYYGSVTAISLYLAL